LWLVQKDSDFAGKTDKKLEIRSKTTHRRSEVQQLENWWKKVFERPNGNRFLNINFNSKDV